MKTKQLLKWFLWLLLALVALIASVYLAARFVNRSDEAVSAQALRFQQIKASFAPIAAADNGFIVMLGFDAGKNVDPYRLGVHRNAWGLRQLERTDGFVAQEFPGDSFDFASTRTAEQKALLAQCRSFNAACVLALEQNKKLVETYLNDKSWVLDRYLLLASRPQWQETLPVDDRIPQLPDDALLEGQRVLFLKAWLLALQGDAAGVKELLGIHIRFLRRALAGSDSLYNKAVFGARLRQHFALANAALRALPANNILAGVPDEWNVPITPAERSMQRPLATEWMRLDDTLLRMKQELGAETAARSHWSTGGLRDRLEKPFMQWQATSNVRAGNVALVADAFDVSYEQLPSSLARLRDAADNDQASNPWWSRAYNPMGKALLAEVERDVDIASFGPKTADLEGIRRATLLAAHLRSEGVGEERVGDQLATASLRAPYDGKPFSWNRATKSIMFFGIAEGKFKATSILY